jgi:serine/threonine protein kinase
VRDAGVGGLDVRRRWCEIVGWQGIDDRPDVRDYRVVSLIGEGGMGVVYCAEHVDRR